MGKFDSLTCYLDKFETDEIGKWSYGDKNSFPFPAYTELIHEFIKDVHDFCENNPEYDLWHYRDKMKSYGLKSDKSADISSLDVEAVLTLIMWVVRGERFCDGLILSSIKEGRMQAMLRRLKELDNSED